MYLPEDMLIQILSRLPVKSLMRFRTVCKSWNCLVQSPAAFISKHLENHTNSSTVENISQLLVCHRDNLTNKRLVSLFTNDKESITQDLSPFFDNKFGHIRLIGPCNGIVCLYGFTDDIALWNPSIREFRTLPVSLIPRPPDAKILGGDLAFGFDSKTNDYKVMQILFCSLNKFGVAYHVEIYNLTTDSWRKYGGIVPANIMYFNIWSMVYRTETFCWWAKDGDHEIILSFNVANEEFLKTPLPSDIEDLGGVQGIARVTVPMNESIALIVYPQKHVEKFFDIWVLNGLGVEESWTRTSKIGPLSGVERPLGFWKKGEFILENSSGELVLYDCCTLRFKNLGLQGKRDRLEVLVYKESLVSLANGSES